MTYLKTTDGEHRLIRLVDVQRRTGLSRTGIYARMAEGAFPGRVSIGGRAVAWVESEVDAWVKARIEQRGSGQADAASGVAA